MDLSFARRPDGLWEIVAVPRFPESIAHTDGYSCPFSPSFWGEKLNFFVFFLQGGPNGTGSSVDRYQRRHVNELLRAFGLRLGKRTGGIYGLGEAMVTRRQLKPFWLSFRERLRLWGSANRFSSTLKVDSRSVLGFLS